MGDREIAAARVCGRIDSKQRTKIAESSVGPVERLGMSYQGRLYRKIIGRIVKPASVINFKSCSTLPQAECIMIVELFGI